MTAPLLNSSVQSLSTSSRFAYCAPVPPAGTLVGGRATQKQIAADKISDRLAPAALPDDVALSAVYRQVLELLPQGAIIVSRSFKPIYWNGKAKDLCRRLLEENLAAGSLPLTVSEACHRFIRAHQPEPHEVLLECQVNQGQVLRISARWLDDTSHTEDVIPLPVSGIYTGQDSSQTHQDLIAVFLEHCDEVLQGELRIQQRKYDLTDREAEIWMLLRKEHTYQDIAQMLQISLNTVKTHVKNVYAKRRSCQGQEKFWCCE